MSNVGPVCHIPPKTTPGNPQPQALPGLPGPASPSDPVSMANLLNAVRLAMLPFLNNNQKPNNTAINDFITKPSPDSRSSWVEVERVHQKVRVYQNNDKTSPNYVDINQINKLVMQHKKTGERWVWQRGASNG